MNKKYLFPTILFARIRFLFFTLCALCALSGVTPAQDFKTVHDGVEYAQVVHKLGSDPVKINLLRLDLKKVRLDVHHAMDAAIGTEKTSSLAERQGAVAAINAGFFRLDTSIFAGNAVSFLMIDKEILSNSTNNRIAIGISNRPNATDVQFGRPDSTQSFQIGRREFEISGVNRERRENDIILYNPVFHATTLTRAGGIELVVRRGRISQIVLEKGSSKIPRDGYVISADSKFKDDLAKIARVGSRVELLTKVILTRISHEPDPPTIEESEDAVAGVPQLVKDGKIDITWEQEKSSKAFVETRHPRTAVAKLKDGNFLMITVDGRQPGVSVGMNLYELADYLMTLGATDAMNLDGGGSTTMFLDGKVVNKPSDKEGERKVSDAILVTLRKNRSGNRE